MFKKAVFCLLVLVLSPGVVWSLEVYHEGDNSLDIAFWGQAWYQYVQDGRDTDNDGTQEQGLNDFMFRRAYLTISGTATPNVAFFIHYAGDRLGQDGLDNPGSALGSGLALRDGWISTKLLGDALIAQAGRMYVPFTRNFGTTSTKALLTTDLDWTQGGVRGSTFYPSKVGRDDGLCLWGNVMEDRLQYRFMISEGGECAAANPEDNLRLVGRMSYSFFEPEKGWFNQGTYLGKKRVLAAGLGIDRQPDLVSGGVKKDYVAWTVDVFYDQPMGKDSGLTVEAAYIQIENGPNAINYTRLAAGGDGSIISMKAGYLLGERVGIGQVQPFAHFENLNVAGNEHTNVFGAGVNYFIKGHPNKLSLDLTYIDQGRESYGLSPVQDHFVATLEFAAGF